MKNNGFLNDIKVLYVEDDPDVREQLAFFLRKKVGKLFIANDGDQGISIFKNEKPDVVVTDLKMPVMDGIQMSKAIRQLDNNCSIIITTAFSDVEQILMAVDAGISKYLIKPIDPSDLIDAMKELAKINHISEGRFTLVGDHIYRERDDIKEIEMKIQKEVAHYVKTSTGKGPQYVKSMIRGQLIEIDAKGALTLMEKKLLEKRKNVQLVQFAREAFFSDCKHELEAAISKAVGAVCIIQSMVVDLKSNMDHFIVKIENN